MSRADGLFPAAVGLAEGGWVAVVYLLVDAIARVDAPLSPVTFVVVAGLACASAGWLDRLAASRLTVIVGLLVGGGLLGIVLSAASAATFGGRDPVAAATHDPGAVLLGLAALRGFIRAGAQRDPGQAARPFLVGLVGLAAAWIFAGALSEPMRSTFRDAAVLPTIAFVVGGLASTGLASSALASTGAGFDPLANRPWVVAMLGLAVGLGVAALPMGAGLERMMAALIAWPLTPAARDLRGDRRPDPRPVAPSDAPPDDPLDGRSVHRVRGPRHPRRHLAASRHGAGTRGVGRRRDRSDRAGYACLQPDPDRGRGRRGHRGPAVPGPRLATERGADRPPWRRRAVARLRWRGHRSRRRPGLGQPAPSPRRSWPTDRRRHRLPCGAQDDRVRRGAAATAGQTPAQHAHRLHGLGFGSLELDLLAADFELARWGGRRLSGSEDRRALGRLERFRRRMADRLPDG